MARVRIIHTGGTLGMARRDGLYKPQRGHLLSLMQRMPELTSATPYPLPDYELVELDELLDSSNMTPGDWRKIALEICHRYDEVDGFVILHGTDTMAYTASALSFMLENLSKPVIMTGSQIPLMEPRNDAREHLITSMLLAATVPLREVCLYFHGQLLRGNRSTKADADGYDAFVSPNCPPLGTVGVRIDVPPPPATTKAAPLRIANMGAATVASLRIFPGIKASFVGRLLEKDPPQGLILECYGAGNAPDRDGELLRVLGSAVAAGVVIVDVTQCLRGTVNLQIYETGSKLHELGVTSGLDMTPEAALAKLFYLLEKRPALSPQRIRKEMQRSLRHELTDPAPHRRAAAKR